MTGLLFRGTRSGNDSSDILRTTVQESKYFRRSEGEGRHRKDNDQITKFLKPFQRWTVRPNY